MTDTPLADVDPNSVTLLFERDPLLLKDEPGQLDRLVAEFRRRADVAAAEEAAKEAAPKEKAKGKRGPRTGTGQLIDLAVAALADKPVEELTIDDLFEEGEE